VVTPRTIDSFTGAYEFLSNFSSEGEVRPSVEHHYQAAKTLDPAERERILKAPTAGQAKKLGRKVELREDWEQIKLWLMLELLLEKFADQELLEALLATGDATLIEGNWWGDKFWGVCDDEGLNWLGRLLEIVRSYYNQ
jgi:ribA/ribD-fused uncharacterized protein